MDFVKKNHHGLGCVGGRRTTLLRTMERTALPFSSICRQPVLCTEREPFNRCSTVVSPRSSWGGLGNMFGREYIPLTKASARGNCTIRFNEANNRGFRIHAHFDAPTRIPTEVTSSSCVAQALLRRPTNSNFEQVQRALRPLLASSHPPHNSNKPKLLALHLRTGWADVQGISQKLWCNASVFKRPDEDSRAFFALLMARRLEKTKVCRVLTGRRNVSACDLVDGPSLESFVSFVLRAAKQVLRGEVALFVASDSPAAKFLAVQHARRHGVLAATAGGPVGHVSAWPTPRP